MKDLFISGVQANLIWEDKKANLSKLSSWVDKVPVGTQIVVLPEMFSTGFSMNPKELAEQMDGPTVCWLKEQALKRKCIVTGSLIIEEDGKFYNRLIWMLPNGTHYSYDKRHLFGFAGEEKFYRAGDRKVIVQVNGWKICLQVCYDLRFPVWARQSSPSADPSYDVLLYVANWPEKRIKAWDTLLCARAIENQSYVIGINRTGNDGNGIYHDGSSSIIDPWGEVLANIRHEEGIIHQRLSAEGLLSARRKLPFLKDGDAFLLV